MRGKSIGKPKQDLLLYFMARGENMNIIKSFRLVLILSLLGMFLGSPLRAQAQTATGSIAGWVRDENNIPINMAIPIAFYSELDGSFVDGTCSSSGTYLMTDLPLGSYLVAAGDNGFTCGPIDFPYAREYWFDSPFQDNAT